MKALLLAAGYATRLYPLTLDRPKALLPVGSRPIIDYILQNIRQVKEIDEVFVVTNHKFFSHFADWARIRDSLIDIKIIDDGTVSNDDRLGAIGDINFVVRQQGFKDDLLVVGADNIFQDRLADFVKFSKRANCVGLYDLGDKRLASKYGIVSIDKEGRIIDFKEKPEKPASTLISTCIYYFPSEKLALFQRYLSDKGSCKDASGNYIKWLSDNDSVYGYLLSGKWYDIGDLESYKKADEDFSRE